MNVLIAWIVYFVLWAVAIAKGEELSKNKILVVLCAIISLADVVYLFMHDLRGLILVVLGTVFALVGLSLQLVKEKWNEE